MRAGESGCQSSFKKKLTIVAARWLIDASLAYRFTLP
jgi:hypothetical protein